MITNRPYISYSQYTLFKTSPKAFYNRYVLEAKNYGTKYQQFGKKLMEDLEFGEMKSVPRRLRELVKANVVEHEITVAPKDMDKELFGIVDAIYDTHTHFFEIKTGKHAWDELAVQKDEQMLFYAMLIEMKYKVIPKATLIWAETEDAKDGSVKFTGKVEAFIRNFTIEEIRAFHKKIKETAEEIDNYVHTISEMGGDVDERLLYLMSEKKRIDSELDLLKAELLVELREDDTKYAQSENFNITLVSRKNWTYSENIGEIIKKNSSEVKLMKLKEEKNGTATMSSTEYLMIKAKK